MLAEGDRPDRPPPDPPLAAAAAPVGAPSAGVEDTGPAQLRPVTIPLSVSGASDTALSYLGEELRASGLRPVRAGGSGGKAPAAAAPLVPGAAVGVALVSGDMTTTAMGTLTYSDGRRVFAFGHPMFGIGSVSLPFVQSEVHAIIPSLSSSLKMASPVAEIGTITDDSRSGVIGQLGVRSGTVPLQVRVTSQGVAKPPFTVEIARHRRLLPMLATVALSTALGEAVPDVTNMTAEVTTRLFLRGFPPLELRDYLFTNDNLAPRVLAMSHGIRALGELSGNVFEPAVVEKIEVGVRVEYRADTAAIVALTSSGGKVLAGTRLPLRVTLRPYHGAEFVETVNVELPRALAGRTVKIEVASGAQVKPELPRAENLRGMVENLRTYYPAASLVVSLTTADDGIDLHGRLLRNLPPSAVDTLRSASQSRRGNIFRVVKRTAFPKTRVLSGKSEIQVQVRDPAVR
jgi:hypothetical protein